MVNNCTWLEDISYHLFCNLQNKRWQHIHKVFNQPFIFKQINNKFCCVKTTKQFPFIKRIFHPKFGIFAHFSTSLVDIFHFLIIKLKKPKFSNWLPNRRHTISPFNNLMSWRHINLNKRKRCKRNNMKIRMKTWIKYKKR